MVIALDLKLYDHFSFDLDNTISEYNINTLYTSQCQYMLTYLSKVKHYQKLQQDLTKEDISFISRGLFIDYEKGNLLKLNKDGVIVRASHGTKMLDIKKIAHIYGSDCRWSLFKEIRTDPLKIISPEYIKKIMALMDFTHASLSLVYGKAIDTAPLSGKTIAQVQIDLHDAINSMYMATSSWSVSFITKLHHYVYRQNNNLVRWLRTLKSIGYTSLVTSSDEVLAPRVAACALGNDWRELFNFIVYSSRKPFFFTETHPFQALELSEPRKSRNCEFALQGEFTKGSFHQVENALTAKLGRKPRSIYFGDSPINDLIGAKEAVAIIEEAAAENFFPYLHNNRAFLTSTQWGSLFYENEVPTWFGNIVLNTKFCAPSLKYFTRPNENYQYIQTWYK